MADRQLDNPPEEQELFRMADTWGIRHGGISGRAAQQFIDSLSARE